MNKQEYKQLSHDIRTYCRREAAYKSEKTGKRYTTRGEMHNTLWWFDDLIYSDCFGKRRYKYECIGDYDCGLIWFKTDLAILCGD